MTPRGFDPETGEVQDEPRKPRGPWGHPKRTPEEQAEAKRIRAERDELRRQEVAALRALDPACETEDDPPLTWRPLVPMGGEPNGILLACPRLSGRGQPGSRLVLAARSYDGTGPHGGEACDYLTAFVVYRDVGGYERRTTGTMIRRSELREVARAIMSYADELDARDVALARHDHE